MANFTDKQRTRLAQQGKAMEGGRYPIRNKADLANAIQAVGRASGGEQGRAAVRRWIIRRARALGAMGLIPDSWKAGASR